jgi:hypothetical protein
LVAGFGGLVSVASCGGVSARAIGSCASGITIGAAVVSAAKTVLFTNKRLLKKARQNHKLLSKSFDIVAPAINKVKIFVSCHRSFNWFYLT